jgi:low affinity Fe/Cu permease
MKSAPSRALRYENATSKRPKKSHRQKVSETNFRDEMLHKNTHKSYSHIDLSYKSYFLHFPAHCRRAFSSVVREIASSDERRHLQSSKNIRYKGTVNLLVWRRSTFVLLILATIFTLTFQMSSAVNDWEGYLKTVALGEENVTYSAYYNDTVHFRSFTQRVTKSAIASALRDVKWAHFWIQVVTLGLTVLAFMSIILAQCKWDQYKTSRKCMLSAWILSFATPFAVSAAPTRTLVKWDRFDNQTNELIDGFAIHFKIDETAAQVTSSCTELISPNSKKTLEQSRKDLQKLCNMIPDNVVGNFFSGGKANRAKKKCKEAKQLLESNDVDSALKVGKSMCTNIIDTIDQVNSGEQKDLQIVQVAADLMVKVKLGAEVGISLYSSFWAVKAMIPAAVALAPALMRGGLKIKVLIPQSSIPGMLVVILPWLYCPMLWIVYSVIFQMVGDLVLFLGLAIMAFAPLFTYFALGMCLHVPKPTDDDKIKFVVQVMSISSSILSLSSLILISYWVFGKEGEHQGLANEAMKDMFSSPLKMTGVLASTIFKWFVTTIAGVDFVVGEIASQRDYEVYLETGTTERGIQGVKASWNMNQEDRLKIKGMMADRNERLDDICKSLRV